MSVFDADNFSSEFNCGSEIPLEQLCSPEGVDGWFGLEYQDKVVGKIHFVASLIPDAK